MREIDKAGWAGAILGALATAILFAIYIQAANLQVPAGCYEDEVVVWDGETNSHKVCIPLDNITGKKVTNGYATTE